MDLVDIDQVLDNLELREAADEHNRSISAGNTTTAQNAAESTNNPSKGDNGSAVVSLNSSNHKSGFVGVSQVFNSLDDYQKNVESLETAPTQRYDEECRLISDEAKPTQDLEKISNENEFVDGVISDNLATNQIQENTLNNDMVVKTIDARSDSSIELAHDKLYEDDAEDEEEASDDLHKFTEDNRHIRRIGYEENEVGGNSPLSSDSLTTSSSSTFSSGPSPGIVSTTDEHSAPLTPDDECASDDRDALLPVHPIGTEPDDEDDEEPGVMTDEDIADDGKESDLMSAPQAESTGGIEDIAVGLSSISLATGNSQLNLPTVSSVLQNVLEDLSETTSNSLLSQQRKETGEIQNSESAPLGSDDFKKLESAGEAADEKIAGNNLECDVPPHKPLPIKVLQQPITFGSTMDEISDAELDSMLQEMDIDDVSEADVLPKFNVSANHNSPPQPQPTAIIAKEVENVVAFTPPKSTTKHEETCPDSEVNVASETCIAGNNVAEMAEGCVSSDHVNADSFSQASTVEFSELRAHSIAAAHTDTNMMPVSNSVASSYTGSECSLEGGVIGGERISDEEVTTGTVDYLVKNSAENTDDESGSTDEGAYGEGAAQRPQRPTSLNLPMIQSNLYENAGQTPPGTQTMQNSTMHMENTNSHAPNASDTNSTPIGSPEDEIGAINEVAEATGYSDPYANLGKVPPIWVPDNMATGCMQCHAKFTMIKRRHHCRACGKVLCSVCCSQKFKLEFLSNTAESRVCLQCFLILTQRQQGGGVVGSEVNAGVDNEVASAVVANTNAAADQTEGQVRSPNPNNPMEYCSTIPPYRQVDAQNIQPPSVIVPVGVLKKEGSSYSSNSSNGGGDGGKKGRKRKSVMFSDGIAPGSDLASMEHQWADAKHARRGAHQQGDKSRGSSGAVNKPPTPVRTQPSASSSNSDATTIGLVASLFRGSIPPMAAAATMAAVQDDDKGSTKSITNKTKGSNSSGKVADAAIISRPKRLPPSGSDENGCFIPPGDNNTLPPVYVRKDESNCDFDFKEVQNNQELVARLRSETLRFALEKNLFVDVKILNLKCCMNRTVINFTTSGMHHVGNDELIILLELESQSTNAVINKETAAPIPKDIFVHLYEIYRDAELGNPIAELSYTSPRSSNFLGTRDYGGFIFIRATFQCLQDVLVPEQPFLIGILIHRYEVPWAKVFPLRLMLRLGAQYRYYPCPHISIRNRESVYAEIAQTIINFLADFRNYSYTLPCIKGMYIHMEDRQTTVMIPRNRQDDVIKAIKNASDHILAFGGNFSKTADGHLVCMQNVNDMGTEMYAYSTQAINIQGQPRKVTGASFFVLNESLKSTSGLSGKCSIVEDGLMVQILPSKMEEIRNSLQNHKDVEIICGPVDADDQQTEVVSIKWVENDTDFNVGVKSPIDEKSMEGISSMRVHDSFNYANANYAIRLTDIYILKYDEWYTSAQSALAATSMDITRMAGQIARSACVALVPFLDLLVASGSRKLALRATLHQENVCYEAGTRGNKLPPLYMNALDDNLIPTLHGESSGIEDAIILELVFYILNC
ncbi:zinc finger FYVE domain-containing protein 9 [Bactrocera dorsalis]|uniref:Zinc finger FYVE domain-containing protein 9 n=1 Tax=Bactrocera dorsalis TaxID=27457 RepID=A0A6I9V7D3_BACDO|nr:zinc finger FYVE domain-containing protein 9 [Bactrocera dorsalis]XP_011198661.2 zinc finger FYVE domain-containing protein 9 [Bactrocera dorsalis]XP_011198662.2 zinc finger FYVE domain-containing protein 9 [Bactrocera dorsalis]XP_049307718.1 zinc finger FYVE domain-containing protein 9 [Bactrocera dorsalis]